MYGLWEIGFFFWKASICCWVTQTALLKSIINLLQCVFGIPEEFRVKIHHPASGLRAFTEDSWLRIIEDSSLLQFTAVLKRLCSQTKLSKVLAGGGL